MKNKEANIRLIKRILELKNGTYNVNTINGNFNIRKNCSYYEENYNTKVFERDILIEDEKVIHLVDIIIFTKLIMNGMLIN